MAYLCAEIFCVLTCLTFWCAWRARLLTCFRTWRARVLACSRMFACYVLTCSNVLHACCSQTFYVLTCLCAWYPQMSCLLYIWKVNFQKFLCRIIWLLFGGVFRTQFYDSAFAKKIDDKKPLSVFPDNHRYLPGL